MNTAQARYGPHDADVQILGDAAFGRCLYRVLPEDRFDRQPLTDAAGRWLFAADVRLDDREALAHRLGIGGANLVTKSDSDLLFRACLEWGERVVERFSGDFAFALWDSHERSLLLARDPMGRRPLQYYPQRGGFAFASMPAGLLALGIDPELDLRAIAAFLADAPPSDGYMAFRNLKSLPAGHMLRWTPDKIGCRRYWEPTVREVRFARQSDYVDAFREKIDDAVRSRLRGCEGNIGAQLSSGFDSSTVTTTAARLLAPVGGKVVAFTAAPRQGFDGPTIRGTIADESEIAAVTASRYPNIEHVVIRSDGTSPFEQLDERHRLAQFPVGHVCNMVWWTRIQRAARDRGLNVLLTGELGNMTISAGGVTQLADLIRTGRWFKWLREALAVPQGSGVSWKGIATASFGPWIPRPLWGALAQRFMSVAPDHNRPIFLAEPFRSEMIALHASQGRDTRPSRDSMARRRNALKRWDTGHFCKAGLARWGVDERDPTSDTRLIDFCLSLPPDQLLDKGVRRPLAQTALADRMPQAVLNPTLRGYQMADWYEQITFESVRAATSRLGNSDAARALIDFDRINATIDRWPRSGWERIDTMNLFRMRLLRALGAAQFVAVQEKEASLAAAVPDAKR